MSRSCSFQDMRRREEELQRRRDEKRRREEEASGPNLQQSATLLLANTTRLGGGFLFGLSSLPFQTFPWTGRPFYIEEQVDAARAGRGHRASVRG